MAQDSPAQDNPPDEVLRAILEDSRVIAVVGASATPGKPSHDIPAYLQAQGYRIVPVNPSGDRILGEPAVTSLAEVTEPIDVVQVFRPSEETPAIAGAAVDAGASVLWLQSGIANEEAAATAAAGGLTVVMDTCMKVSHRRLGLKPAATE